MNDENNGIKNMANDESYGQDPDADRRQTKRFVEKLSARIEDERCFVLNISDKGVLLQTSMPVHFFPVSKAIDFELRLEDGQWITMNAKVMWVQSDQLNSKIGLFIQQAPEPYLDFLKRLYE